MKALLKKLWGDRRGNALVIAGAALPLLVGAAGLATDTVHWALWKRQMQRSADSAALAGVYARAQNETLSLTGAEAIVTHDMAENNHLAVPLMTGYPQVSFPADTGTWTYKVKVDMQVQKPLGFSSLFLSAAPIIKVSATAAMIPDGNYCVVALKKTGVALNLGGSANVNMGCGAISNSTDPTSSVTTNGNAYNFIADPVAAAGGMPTSIIGATDIQPYHVALPDPFANKYPTSIPPSQTCTNFNQKISGPVNGTNGVVELTPGCYNQFNPGNNTYHLNPGVYYLNSVNLSLSGQTILTGTGVTIILTGTTPGSLSMNGNSAIQLTAPTDATCGVYNSVDTCAYKKMLLIQSPNATAGNNNTINGDNNTSLDGAIYFPAGDLQVNGSSANSTKCAMIVSYTVDFTGNTNIQNNTTGCTANQTVSAKAVRLIA